MACSCCCCLLSRLEVSVGQRGCCGHSEAPIFGLGEAVVVLALRGRLSAGPRASAGRPESSCKEVLVPTMGCAPTASSLHAQHCHHKCWKLCWWQKIASEIPSWDRQRQPGTTTLSQRKTGSSGQLNQLCLR